MKKYQIIYADPGWKYGSRGCRSGRYGELDYTQMKTKDICALPVKEITAKDCALFLWFTGSFAPDALKVIDAWGFKPVRIDKVWAKKTVNKKPHAVPGPWGMSDAEFLMLATRGAICNQQIGKRNQHVVTEVEYPGEHSKKPDVFREMIASRFPKEFKKIELFARSRSPGWDAFGNEIDSDIKLEKMA